MNSFSKYLRVSLFLNLLLWPSFSVFAQFPRFNPTPGDTLTSIRVGVDKKVCISVYAPKASEVTVSGDFIQSFGGVQLTKDDLCIWSVVVGPLSPDLYSYDFRIDGVKVLDPRNTHLKEGANGYSNLFEVAGAEAEYQAAKDVPHGRVEKVWFQSSITGEVSRAHIYTPPGYEEVTGKLPVLYLQHGGGDNDASWSTAGRANFILDNLMAEGKIKPMVVVMPNGNPAGGFHGGFGVGADPYYRYFFEDLVPYVESHYKVETTPEYRAYAGLSMGGLQALNMALFYADRFSYILPLSTGFFPNLLGDLESVCSKASTVKGINQLKLFWLAMGGEQDIAFQNGENTKAIFDRYGIKYQTNSYPAGHTFITWRHDLKDFAPLLFK